MIQPGRPTSLPWPCFAESLDCVAPLAPGITEAPNVVPLSLRGPQGRSNLLPGEPTAARHAGDCFGPASLAMTGGRSELATGRLVVQRLWVLAEHGGKKGDLSKFVEQAVNAELLRATIREVQDRNAHVPDEVLEAEIDQACAEARAEVLRDRKWWSD
jgi:hypothetical protein